MLKIVYPICCGMDVHKSFLVACIASTNERGVTTYKSKRFSTFTKDLHRCAEWLKSNNCKDICMESTGKYWIPIYNILEPSCKIVLAHPKYVKSIRGKKTDKKDAKWIADIFKHDLVNGSFIPPADIRQLRDLVRYRCKANLESLIISTAEKYLSQLELVMSVPGTQTFSAISVIAEIGVDMSVFSSSKHLCSWAGLTPQNNESTGKKKLPEFPEQAFTLSLCWFNAHSALFVPRKIKKFVTAISPLKSADVTRKQLLLSLECCLLPSTTC